MFSGSSGSRDRAARYKWVALSNTTVGMLMATVNSSIVIISLPAIFRGIGLEPLRPGNIGYLLWMLMGYLVATSVPVVTFGRLGDMLGRVRMYNAGCVVFTAASIALAHGLRIVFTAAALLCLVAAVASWLRGGRYVHGEEAQTAETAVPSRTEESMPT